MGSNTVFPETQHYVDHMISVAMQTGSHIPRSSTFTCNCHGETNNTGHRWTSS